MSLRWAFATKVVVDSGPMVPMYTPSCTASNNRAKAAARFSTTLFYHEATKTLVTPWNRGRRRLVHRPAAPFALDRDADIGDRLPLLEQLPGPGCDVDAQGAVEAVVCPGDDVAVSGALAHEAV